MGSAAGIPPEKLTAINTWRDSDAFTDLERLVLEYAEALTSTPAVHRPDLHEALGEHLSEKQLVELTTLIAWENFRARFNRAYDVGAQGFSEGAVCVIPEHR